MPIKNQVVQLPISMAATIKITSLLSERLQSYSIMYIHRIIVKISHLKGCKRYFILEPS